MKTTQRKIGKPTAIILIASPGGGKGTTVTGLTQNGYRVQSLAFREALDEEALRSPRIGKKIEQAREKGQLVPIEIMRKAVNAAFKEIDRSELVILDGLPRDRSQIDLALSGLEQHGYERKIVLHLECNHIIAACRIILRNRDKMDRDPAVIAKRMDDFERITMPVVRDFREHQANYGVQFVHYNTNNLQDEFRNLLRILAL